MRERPIIFSAPMVRALLAGTKTQTRRVFADRDVNGDELHTPVALQASASREGRWFFCARKSGHIYGVDCPYGKPGDRLWVREAFRFERGLDELPPAAVGEACVDAGYRLPWAPTRFEADGATRNWQTVGTPTSEGRGLPQPGRYRHARFMPRWASRITLEITDVRVQRLQEIRKEDARAEGVESWCEECPSRIGAPAVIAFRVLWESINGAGIWDANPWVWALTFAEVQP